MALLHTLLHHISTRKSFESYLKLYNSTKYLVWGHKCHFQDSNPHSADQKPWSSVHMLGHDAPRIRVHHKTEVVLSAPLYWDILKTFLTFPDEPPSNIFRRFLSSSLSSKDCFCLSVSLSNFCLNLSISDLCCARRRWYSASDSWSLFFFISFSKAAFLSWISFSSCSLFAGMLLGLPFGSFCVWILAACVIS